MDATDELIRAEHVYVARGTNPVLRDVGVTVHRGETVAVLGGNGSGKSTLVKAIVGLLPHQEGSIRLFGTPVARFRDWHKVGYVPQHGSIQVPNATVREVAASGRLPHRRPFLPMSHADKEALDHALDVVGLADRAHWPFAALSGGQKQRTLIARALATEPELFIRDEPMAGVDLHSQDGLAELLGELVHRNDKGLLVVLHEIRSMEIDRRVTLCDGRLADEDHLGHHDVGHGDHHPEADEHASAFGLDDPAPEVRA